MENKWEPDEDRKLLNKVLKYGIYQWDKVGEELKNRTKEDLKQRVLDIYSIPLADDKTTSTPEIDDHTVLEKNEVSAKIDVDAKTCEEILYRPQRDDFDMVYDSDAERDAEPFLTDIEIENESEENKIRKELKLSCFQMYRDRIRKRQKVTNIIKKYKLINEFQKWKNDYEEKEENQESALKNLLKLFCHQLPPNKHKALINQFLKEKNCRLKIENLRRKIKDETEKNAWRMNRTPYFPKGRPKSKEMEIASIVLSELGEKVAKTVKIEELVSDSRKLLTKREKKLYVELGLDSMQYMALKLIILKENQQKPGKRISPPYGLNVEDIKKVSDYLSSVGWLTVTKQTHQDSSDHCPI